MPQEVSIGVHDVGVGGHDLGVEARAVFEDHAGGSAARRRDRVHRRRQADRAAEALQQPHQAADERTGAALREPNAPAPLQRVDQGVDGRGLERIAADQQRMERESLAEMLVLDEARHERIDVAVAFELHQRRRYLDHRAEIEERHGPEPDIALLQHGLREGQEPPVTRDVARRHGRDLTVELRLVVGVVEGEAIFPAEAIKGVDLHQRDIVGHAPTRRGPDLLEAGRVRDDRRAAIEGKPGILVDIGPAAGLVAFLQHRHVEAAGLQPNRQGEPAEAGPHHHGPGPRCGFRHGKERERSVHQPRASIAGSRRQRSARKIGTGGFPVSTRALSMKVLRPA